jgi:hydrogenase-1 operon protein HyaF
MSSLNNIGVTVEQGDLNASDWGNALPILHEIRYRLEQLATSGESSLIDLRAIPFGPGDEDRLLELLGRGEVQASIEALGTTRIWESAIPAVWLVDHYNGDGERIALHVEISRIPEILCTPPEDADEAVGRLDARLEEIAHRDNTG